MYFWRNLRPHNPCAKRKRRARYLEQIQWTSITLSLTQTLKSSSLTLQNLAKSISFFQALHVILLVNVSYGKLVRSCCCFILTDIPNNLIAYYTRTTLAIDDNDVSIVALILSNFRHTTLHMVSACLPRSARLPVGPSARLPVGL